jgi:DNA-binding NarL/FixJ family response regulator
VQPALAILDAGGPSWYIDTGRYFADDAHIRRAFIEHNLDGCITQESSPDVVQEALSVGANGLLVKTDASSDLLTAVRAVLRGENFVSQI